MISNVIKIQTVNRVYIHIDANVHCSFGSLAGIALQAWLIVYINLTRCNNFYSSLTLVQFRKLPILSHTSTTITPCDCQLSLLCIPKGATGKFCSCESCGDNYMNISGIQWWEHKSKIWCCFHRVPQIGNVVSGGVFVSNLYDCVDYIEHGLALFPY